MRFSPNEILFSLTSRCNLSCKHCIDHGSTDISLKKALNFLQESTKLTKPKISFTGGEPFLRFTALNSLIKKSLNLDLEFGSITTNGIWFKKKTELISTLTKLYKSKYDGLIYLSVDQFHNQNIKKLACFIKTAIKIFHQPDLISILMVTTYKDNKNILKLKGLAKALNAQLKVKNHHFLIQNNHLLIRTHQIPLVIPIKLKNIPEPWTNTWFKEDFCKALSNIFFITSKNKVKPCCGYANHAPELTIGDITKSSPKEILNNLKNNRFVYTILNSGLTSIRKRLEKKRWEFPGKTENHCFFCNYLITRVPKSLLYKVLD